MTAEKASSDYRAIRGTLAILAAPILLFVSILMSSAVAVLFGLKAFDIQASIFISAAAEVVSLILVLLLGRLRPLKEFFFLRITKWWHIPFGAFVGLVGYVFLQLGAKITSQLVGSQVGTSDTSSSLGEIPGIQKVLILFLFVSLLGPILEELYFRGFIVSSLQHSKLNKTWFIVLVSAISFGVMHFQGASTATDVFVLLWTAIIGAGFAGLLIWSKSIWTSASAHIAYNLITAISLLTLAK